MPCFPAIAASQVRTPGAAAPRMWTILACMRTRTAKGTAGVGHSYLPYRDDSICLIATLSILHWATMPYSSALRPTLSPKVIISGGAGASIWLVSSAGRFSRGWLIVRYSTCGFCCTPQPVSSISGNRSNSALIRCKILLNFIL